MRKHKFFPLSPKAEEACAEYRFPWFAGAFRTGTIAEFQTWSGVEFPERQEGAIKRTSFLRFV
jgi:hypothetical protein